MMPDLLSPGTHRAAGCTDDAALVDAMLRVEIAWLRALAHVGVIDVEHAETAAAAAAGWHVDVDTLIAESESAGNPVLPLITGMRAVVGDGEVADVVHRGLTSQDVLDTALVLLARDALLRVRADLGSTCETLAALADGHRGSIMAGRTLTQHAVPVTFGLKAAQWLSGVLDAITPLDSVLGALPVQCGGAAGTLALVAELTVDPEPAARAFAHELGLTWPGMPWHTNRAPVTSIGSAVVAACDAVGVIATDVAFLSRPEIAEVREGASPGRGDSSTMPHKRNPVLSILVRSASLQAPLLGAQLHLAAAQAIDERPDGAWHSEWPALRRLLELGVTAASQSAELVAGLAVDAAAMRRRAESVSGVLLAERGAGDDLEGYLGAANEFVDVALTRLPEGRLDHG